VREDGAVRRALMIASTALVTAALVLALETALTLLWKEPVTAIAAALDQDQAADQLDRLEAEFGARAEAAISDAGADPAKRAAVLADLFEAELEEGRPIGRILAPSAGVEDVIIEGTDAASLEKGPGHYPKTALPGQGRTVAIAGHRTTYGAPFHDIDSLREGDRVTLEMPYATFTYVVTKTDIVDPSDVEIVEDVGRERLVLTACHPLYSAAERYAIFADLERVSLFTGDRSPWLAP
jgi:sortase A